jgi:hypothetical protein
MGSSINDVTQIIFDTPYPDRHVFHYKGFSTVVTKSLTTPTPKSIYGRPL